MPDNTLVIRVEGDASGATASFTLTEEQLKKLKSGLDEAGGAGKKAGADIAVGAKHAEYSMMEARHGVMLLGEEFGIHLPRALTTFIASLGPVGAAMEAAFPYLAILVGITLLVGHLVKVSEEAEKVKEATDKMSGALEEDFNKVDKAINEASIKIRELVGLPAWDLLAEKIRLEDAKQGIDNMSRLEKETKEFLATIPATSNWNPFNWLDHSDDIKAEVGALQDMVRGKPETDQLETMQAQLTLQKHVLESESASGELEGVSLDHKQKYVAWLQQQVDLMQKNTDAQVLANQAQQTGEAETGVGEKQKQILDQRLANIAEEKAEAHLAFAEGRADAADWAVAQVKAANEAREAHENYLSSLIAVYTKLGDLKKADVAASELSAMKTKDTAEATEQLAAAEEKHRLAMEKIVKEYGDMVNKEVEKNWEEQKKAAVELAQAEDELAKAQAKLAEAQSKLSTDDSVNAVKRAADAGLISQKRANEQLAQLYKDDANNRVLAQADVLNLLTTQETAIQTQLAADMASHDNLAVEQDRTKLAKIQAQEADAAAKIYGIWAGLDNQLAGLDEKQELASQKYFSQFNSLFANQVGQVLSGHERMGQAALKMYQQMTLSMIKYFIEKEMKTLEDELYQKLAEMGALGAHAQALALKAAADKLAQAQAIATKKAADAAQGATNAGVAESNAAVAATGAAAAAGPGAPEAAAATEAAMQPYVILAGTAVSAEVGGMMEGGLTLTHPREAVLNPTQTSNFQRMTESGGGAAKMVTFAPQVHVHGDFNADDHMPQILNGFQSWMRAQGVKL